MGPSERYLVWRLKRGDRDACRDLIRIHHGRVYGYLRHLGADATIAEDLTQETYSRAWRRIETLRRATSLRSWLLTIARNQFLQWVRVRRVDTVSLDDASVTDAMSADKPAEIDRDLTLRRAVADLDPTLGEMVVLHYFTGLTLNEVGVVLDLPVGTVKSRIHRALAALRAVLEGRETNHENKRAGKALADPS